MLEEVLSLIIRHFTANKRILQVRYPQQKSTTFQHYTWVACPKFGILKLRTQHRACRAAVGMLKITIRKLKPFKTYSPLIFFVKLFFLCKT